MLRDSASHYIYPPVARFYEPLRLAPEKTEPKADSKVPWGLLSILSPLGTGAWFEGLWISLRALTEVPAGVTRRIEAGCEIMKAGGQNWGTPGGGLCIRSPWLLASRILAAKWEQALIF